MFGLSQARFAEKGSGPNSRQKRWIDFAGGWKNLLTGFHPAVQAVEENAQIRMAAEASPDLNPIEYAHPVLPAQDPYQTNFNPGDEILYVSMSRSPMEEGHPLKNKVELVQKNQQEVYSENSVHKRSADVQYYNPGERSALLGKGPRDSVTHYSQVGGAPVGRATSKVENLNVQVSKRSVKDLSFDDMELADMIIAESKTPEEALAKMLDAEKFLDTALHEVMGDLHESDAKDVKNLEQIIDTANLVKKTPMKRSIETNVEKAIIKSSEHIAAAHNLLEKNDREEKALEEIMEADKNLSDLLQLVLNPAKVEESRTKRDHNSEYYDPDFQWLINNLQMTQEEGDQVRNIVYGESSVDGPQFYKPVSYASSQTSQYNNQPSIYSNQEPGKFVKYDQHPVYHTSESGQVYYTNDGRQNKMEDEKSTYQKFLDHLQPFADAVPDELNAAYRGALDVGKHVTKQVRPYAHQGYDTVTKNYIPKATQIVSSSVGKDVKDFARQGRKIVETRARYATQAAGYAARAADPHLESIKDDIWMLQEQLKQVAQETSEYAKKEVVPSIGPTLKGLIFDIQETLELANQMIVNDVAPLIKKVSESYIQPTYSSVTSGVVYPAASKVNDYVVRPVAGGFNDYIVDPVNDYVVNPVAKTAPQVYQTAHRYASSGVDTARSTYQRMRPTIDQLSASTQKVMSDSVVPTAQVAASQVADGAYQIGNLIQNDVVPNMQQGVSTTLDGLFTGIPSLLKKVSHGANDAATIFSNRYAQALDEIKTKAEIKRKEQESKLNMIKKEMKLMQEAEKIALNEIDYSTEEDSKKFDAVVKAFVEDVKDLEDSNTTREPITVQTVKPETVQPTTPKEL